jgi:RNA polymerase sigma-B factor
MKKVAFNPHLGDFNEFYINNEALIGHFMKEFQHIKRNHFSYEDLFSEATVGFVKAYKGFDPDKNPDIKFSTYAHFSIRGQILRFLNDHGSTVKIPRRTYSNMIKIKKIEDYDRLSISDISKILNIPEEETERALEALPFEHSTSIDAGVPGSSAKSHTSGSNDVQYHEVLPGEEETSEIVENKMMVEEILKQAKEILGERNRNILMDYLLNGTTQNQLGKKHGINQVQVSRIINKSINKLKESKSFKEFRGEDDMRKNQDFNLPQAQKLLRETNKNVTEISEETGVAYATVYYHSKQIRGKEGKKVVGMRGRDSQHGNVVTRPMTEEERKRIKKTPAKEKREEVIVEKEEVVEEVRDKIFAVAQSEVAATVLKEPTKVAAKTEPIKADSSSYVQTDFKDIASDDFLEEYKKLVEGMRIFGFDKMDIRITAKRS